MFLDAWLDCTGSETCVAGVHSSCRSYGFRGKAVLLVLAWHDDSIHGEGNFNLVSSHECWSQTSVGC